MVIFGLVIEVLGFGGESVSLRWGYDINGNSVNGGYIFYFFKVGFLVRGEIGGDFL